MDGSDKAIELAVAFRVTESGDAGKAALVIQIDGLPQPVPVEKIAGAMVEALTGALQAAVVAAKVERHH